MPDAEVYGEMAKGFVIEGTLQVGEYTISQFETFQTFLDRRFDSAGTFMVKAKLTTILREDWTIVL
jgi:hypothetical protein